MGLSLRCKALQVSKQCMYSWLFTAIVKELLFRLLSMIGLLNQISASITELWIDTAFLVFINKSMECSMNDIIWNLFLYIKTYNINLNIITTIYPVGLVGCLQVLSQIQSRFLSCLYTILSVSLLFPAHLFLDSAVKICIDFRLCLSFNCLFGFTTDWFYLMSPTFGLSLSPP